MPKRSPLRTARQIVDASGSPIFTPSGAGRARADAEWFDSATLTRNQIARPQQAHDTRQDMSDTVRRATIGLSRWLYWNTYIGQVIDERANECVGNSWEPRYLGADKDWGKTTTQWFVNWGMACDVTGRLTFWDHLELGLVEHHRDGDGFRMFAKGSNDYPLLQAIPAHRVGTRNDNETVGGIIPNAQGRPRFYRVTTDDPRKSPTLYDSPTTDIPAASIHHIISPKFVDQYRGMPAVVRGARTQTDQNDIVEFEKVAVKMASSVGLLRSTQDGSTTDAFNITSKGNVLAGSLPLYQFAAGAMPTIPKDAQFESFAHNRPGQTWQGFMEYLSRLALMAMGSRYEYAFDPSSLTGPAMRFVMAREKRAIEKDQWIIEKLARRVWGYAIGSAAKIGIIPPLPADWYNIGFTKPRSITIDVGREALAEQNDYLLGWKTRAEHLGEAGIDPDTFDADKLEEVRKRWQDAKAVATEFGISIQEAFSSIEERALIAPPAEEPPPKGKKPNGPSQDT